MASVYFNGNRYTRSGKYYYKTRWKDRTALHRDVWSFHNGPIPDGWHVHHIDHDRENNDISNLACWSADAHAKHHHTGKRRTPWAAIAKAPEWHGSMEGLEWHRQHGREVFGTRVPVAANCTQCGKAFEHRDMRTRPLRFCSNSCKSAYRRAAGADDVERECAWCGAKFRINRYASTANCSKTCAQRYRAKHG